MGTTGFGDGAVAFGVGGVFAVPFGAAAGAGEMAMVVEERSRKSEKKKRVACFIFQLVAKSSPLMALMILEECEWFLQFVFDEWDV